ncbi:MAG: hypothetical protein JSR80_06835 [Verrucomicrobia bacterium]|nr:hypothetical protein [Verrucomicrobiota bacterium]
MEQFHRSGLGGAWPYGGEGRGNFSSPHKRQGFAISRSEKQLGEKKYPEEEPAKIEGQLRISF